MTHDEILSSLLDHRLTAIVRLPESNRLLELVAAIREAGITCFEITLTTPDALKLLPRVRDTVGPGGLIGAGTVLDEAAARGAIDAGAEFLVSPTYNPAMTATARRYGKVSIPGAFTPTEIMAAWEGGADLVKVFPAEVLGPRFFSAVLRPLPQVRLLPTGNLDLTSARDFLKAGACGVGVGGPLSDPATVAAGRFDLIQEAARQYVELVRSCR